MPSLQLKVQAKWSRIRVLTEKIVKEGAKGFPAVRKEDQGWGITIPKEGCQEERGKESLLSVTIRAGHSH